MKNIKQEEIMYTLAYKCIHIIIKKLLKEIS